MKELKLFYPVKPLIITQNFGVNGEYYRKNGINIKGHNGLDILAYHGQPVYATHDGVVTYAGIDNKEGVGVVIRTDEKYDYKGQELFYKTIYWHLIFNIPVKAGQKVRAGDLIGYADNTGFSTGDHLHFGLKPLYQGENDWTWGNFEESNGYFGAIDPSPYFNKLYAKDVSQILLIGGKLVDALKQVITIYKGRK